MTLRRWLGLADRSAESARSHAGTSATGDTYENDFAEFLMATRGIDEAEARRLIDLSHDQFPGGWAGSAYRNFTERALAAFRPMYDETSPAELFETYRIHAPFDFLRMLSYRIPAPIEFADIADALAVRRQVAIVDYGCGLAHRSVAIARALQGRGVTVHLALVDIRRVLHFSFLSFLCRKHGLSHEFIDVTLECPFPALPAHDYCDTVNVLEHIPEPLRVVDNIHAALRPGGLLVASVADQAAEMMHVSPSLGAVRDRLGELGYRPRRAWLDATVFERAPASA